jgi:hypothetical protein
VGLKNFLPTKKVRLKKMKQAAGFIRYQPKRGNKDFDTEYGTFCLAQRLNNKKTNNERWLGRVIDKENGVFYNNKENYFRFTLSRGKIELGKDEQNKYRELDNKKKPVISKNISKKSIVFGDFYIINEFIKECGLFEIFNKINIDNIDTLHYLILYRLLTDYPNCCAYDIWESSIGQYLFPNASLQSQRISDFLKEIGTEDVHRLFFEGYIEFLKEINPKFIALIDSTGLQNSIKMSLTAVNNHNGIINNEVRLITAVDKISGYPIYFRYIAGNIIDVTTLKMIISELSAYNINIDQAILDAGYYSEDNIILLNDNKIPFLTRMVPRKGFYESLINQHVPNIRISENYVSYGERVLFIKMVHETVTNSKIPVICYICFDKDKYNKDFDKYYRNFDPKTSKEQQKIDELKFGIFILVSSIEIKSNQILPTYYSRQTVEQIFDLMKNDTSMLPLSVHNENTFSGHILICFMATVCLVAINNALKKSNISYNSSLRLLKLYCCRVYDQFLVTEQPTKKVNDIIKAFKIKIPSKIYYNSLNNAYS